MDGQISNGVEQYFKGHGYGGVGEDNNIHTSITTNVVEDKE